MAGKKVQNRSAPNAGCLKNAVSRQIALVRSQQWKRGYFTLVANADQHGAVGYGNVRLCVLFRGREHLSEERFFSPPKPPSLSKDFYSRYRALRRLWHCAAIVVQPMLHAIAAIKVFGKRGARGEKNLSSERCFPLEQFAETYIATPDRPTLIRISDKGKISTFPLLTAYRAF